MRHIGVIFAGVWAVSLIFAASAHADPSTQTTLLGLTMPPGSRPMPQTPASGWCATGCNYPHEEWISGTGVHNTVSVIRPQLPIGRPLNGVPWCTEDDTAPTMPMWMWEGKPGTSEIEVGVTDGDGKGYGDLTIEMHSAGDVPGCSS
jgi:hypothetical protein